MIVAIVKGGKRGMRQSLNEGNVKEYSAVSVAVTQKTRREMIQVAVITSLFAPNGYFLNGWGDWSRHGSFPATYASLHYHQKWLSMWERKGGINKKRATFCRKRSTLHFGTIWQQYQLIQFQIRSTELFMSGWFGQFLSITKCPVGQCRLAFVLCMNTIRYFCPLFCPWGIFTAL